MDKDMAATLARLAGLERALAAFPDDVYAAAAQALDHRDAMRAPTDPTAEPWPPMCPKVDRIQTSPRTGSAPPTTKP
jgi:hypothetical protein